MTERVSAQDSSADFHRFPYNPILTGIPWTLPVRHCLYASAIIPHFLWGEMWGTAWQKTESEKASIRRRRFPQRAFAHSLSPVGTSTETGFIWS